MTAAEVAARARRLEKTALKVQRRVWLAQLLFWPMMLVSAAGVAALLVRYARGQRQPPAFYQPRHLAADGDVGGEVGTVRPERNGHL